MMRHIARNPIRNFIYKQVKGNPLSGQRISIARYAGNVPLFHVFQQFPARKNLLVNKKSVRHLP